MAVRFDANTDGYVTTNGMPTTALTVSCWVRIAVDRNDYSNIWAYDDLSTTRRLSLATDADGTTLAVFDNNLTGPIGPSLTVGTWYFTAVTFTGTTATLYWSTGGALSTTSGSVLAFAGPQQLWIARQAFGPYYLDGSLAAFKAWDAVLTSTELAAERDQYAPARTAGLLRSHPLLTAPGTADESGAGNHLTAGSTATTTDEDGPTFAGGGFGVGFLAVV